MHYTHIFFHISTISTELFLSMLYPSLYIKALLRSRDGDPGACAATAAALRELRRCCGTLRPRWGATLEIEGRRGFLGIITHTYPLNICNHKFTKPLKLIAEAPENGWLEDDFPFLFKGI